MKLTQAERDEIRFALEDAGMPEVLAFMAGKAATNTLTAMGGKINLWSLCVWGNTKQGHDFWWAVADNFGQGIYKR